MRLTSFVWHSSHSSVFSVAKSLKSSIRCRAWYMTYRIEFIETQLFTRLVYDPLDDAEYADVQLSLILDSGIGSVVPGSGGVRKLRWKTKGRGKRGGVRVIYYWRNHAGEIWLLTIYAKSQKENISSTVLKRWRQEIEGHE